MQEEYKVELKSDEYNEMVGEIPPVLIRYGIGVLLAILLVIVILSVKINFTTYIACQVVVGQVATSTTEPFYKVSFMVKPEDIAFIQEGRTAIISLLQYPANRFGNLNIIVHPKGVKYVVIDNSGYYEWSQNESGLVTDSHVKIKYLDGLQGSAKIVSGKESIANKITQSLRNSIGINF